jgi:crossover junction endodeoxyribonuclease RuvC
MWCQSNTMRILGIDPGAGGAVALVAGPAKLLGTYDMPTVLSKAGKRRVEPEQLARLVESLGPIDGAVIELVGPMPRDGSAGSFWFGKSAGVAEGVIAGMGIPCRLVAPQVWKRRLDVPANKDGARARASVLFGSDQWWRRKKDDGRAEAALIGLWGWMDEVAGTW